MNLNIKLEILLIYLIYKIKKQRMVLNRSSFVFFIINIIYGAVVFGAVKLISIYSESVEQHVPDVHTLAINRTEFNMQ